MAAPHIDNPFGAKPDSGGTSATDINKNKGGGKDGNKDKKDKNAKDNKGGVTIDDGPKCAHPYCNEPSDPSDYPIGLPWASGLLKCLPGYCKKHKKDAIDNALLDLDGEELEGEEEEDGTGEKKVKKVCKCKEDTSIVCKHKPEDKPPYKEYVYANDPTVGQELCFFLRMMMVGDELDRWEEEERKAEREAAKKRKEKKKKRNEKKEKGVETEKNKAGKADKKGNKEKKVKVETKDKNDSKVDKKESKTSEKVPTEDAGPEETPAEEVDENVGP